MNHAERREMESILQDRGMNPSNGIHTPDLEIVHTCSVTGQAAAKSRNAIRRAKRNGKHVFVTGCFTGTDPIVAKDLGDTVITQAGDTQAKLITGCNFQTKCHGQYRLHFQSLPYRNFQANTLALNFAFKMGVMRTARFALFLKSERHFVQKL